MGSLGAYIQKRKNVQALHMHMYFRDLEQDRVFKFCGHKIWLENKI